MRDMLFKLMEVKNNLRKDNGLYWASTGKNYRYTWLRDNYHCARVDLRYDHAKYKQTYQTTLDYFHLIEKEYNKISSLLENPYDKTGYRYIHPRFNIDLSEIHHESWGYKQWDAVFMTLKGVVEGENAGIRIIRDSEDIKIINMIIKAAYRMECWSDPESGAWENETDIRLSTLGIILSSLQDLYEFKRFDIPYDFISKVSKAFYALFPNETCYRKYDLAQLFLIYPFKVLKGVEAELIINNIENNLLREQGVIRHIGDWYYNRANRYDMERFGFMDMYLPETSLIGNEAEWVKGFAYLGLAHLTLGNISAARSYLNKLLKGHEDGILPELYFAKSNRFNDNYPLAWTVCAAIELLDKIDN